MHRSVLNCRFLNWQAEAGKYTMQPPSLPPYAHKIVATTSLSPTIFICMRRTKAENMCVCGCIVHMANTKEIEKMRNHKAKAGDGGGNGKRRSERNVLLT